MHLRSSLLLLSCLLLGACAFSPRKTFMLKPSDYELTTGTYRWPLLAADGWRVWRRSYHFDGTCIAIKPAPGKRWPDIDEHRALPHGGAGFYLLIKDGWSQPNLGFYGDYLYDKRSSATIAGQPAGDPGTLRQVLSWEGRKVDFTVSTLPDRDAFSDFQRERGQIDFTGVRAAYAALMRCHTHPPKQKLKYSFGGGG